MHHCTALNIRCIDFRFREFTDQHLEKEMGILDFDLVTKPGGAKELAEKGKDTGLFQDIALSISLHQPEKIILVNHIDCGAYGGSKEFASQSEEEARHKQDLLKAKEILSGEFRDKEIICLFITKANPEGEVTKDNLKTITF